ncbi:uncharacterized protein [Physcomitrium patens]|uniref:Uncharacterized protein n=2 Tax=Physcomitrium patens TaxID=3218 RepID=A0A2K1IFH1_PHYPA|nr:uncharacterized protein LOC112277054 [Physcomitrium patens]PNR28023.1 hypothetical protein PHYPA_028615 [Physcomitrium patens]|eukprot:XP_024364798.1 uncharacterized protein LOC112277054 [Physcomitrella patens]
MKKEQRSRTIEEPRRHVVSHLAVQLHFAQSIARLLVQFVNDRSLSIDPASCFDECVAKMRSLPVRVSATRVTSFKEQLKQAHIALNKKVMKIPPVFTFSKPLPTPLLTWTFRREWRRLPQFASVEVSTESSVASTSVTSSLQSPPTSSHRWSSRGLKGLSTAPRGGAAMVDELCSIEDIKARKGHVIVRSLNLRHWSLFSAITAIAVRGLYWIDTLCQRTGEYLRTRERLKSWVEVVTYWAYVACLLCSWLSIASLLHYQVQRWEFRSMILAGPHEVSDGTFDPGGSFWYFLCPNTGQGCHLYLTTT